MPLKNISFYNCSLSRLSMDLHQRLRDISLPVYLLVLLFNMAAWVDMSAIIAELPLFVNRLPEGWDLGFYFSVTVNTSKIGVVVYALLKKFFGDKVKDVYVIYVIIVVCFVSLVLLAFLWDRTVWIAGQERSIVLLALMACLSTVDCMTSVVFTPYMARFKSQYLTAFFLGEGVGAVLPAMLGVLQGVQEKPHCLNATELILNQTTNQTITIQTTKPAFPDPKFSIKVFFLIISAVMLLSGVAFTLIHFLPYSRRAHDKMHTNGISVSAKRKGKSMQVATSALMENDTKDHIDVEKLPVERSLITPSERPPDNANTNVVETMATQDLI